MPYLKLGLGCIFQTIDYVMSACLVLFQVLFYTLKKLALNSPQVIIAIFSVDKIDIPENRNYRLLIVIDFFQSIAIDKEISL